MLIMFISGMAMAKKVWFMFMYHSNYQLLVFDDSAKIEAAFVNGNNSSNYGIMKRFEVVTFE